MNNAPTGLWSEYERADSTKRFIEQSLSRLNKKPRIPQLRRAQRARLRAGAAFFAPARFAPWWLAMKSRTSG